MEHKIHFLKETPQPEKAPIQPPENDEEVDEEEMMQKLFGFSGFNTTKVAKFPHKENINFEQGKDHSETAEEAVRKNAQQQRKYRQYMNRRGGFNRNLDGAT